jgi:hypothetical protein
VQCPLGIGFDHDLVAGPLEHLPQGPADIGVVVNYQQLHRSHPPKTGGLHCRASHGKKALCGATFGTVRRLDAARPFAGRRFRGSRTGLRG